MIEPEDNERLLADVLTDGTPAGFREALLGETLRVARRRRRFRQARRLGAAAATLALLGSLLWRGSAPPKPLPEATTASYAIIHTVPLSENELVKTESFSPARQITSIASDNIVTTIATGSRAREIGDDELLALVAPRPAALVRPNPHDAELVFLKDADREAFLGN